MASSKEQRVALVFSNQTYRDCYDLQAFIKKAGVPVSRESGYDGELGLKNVRDKLETFFKRKATFFVFAYVGPGSRESDACALQGGNLSINDILTLFKKAQETQPQQVKLLVYLNFCDRATEQKAQIFVQASCGGDETAKMDITGLAELEAQLKLSLLSGQQPQPGQHSSACGSQDPWPNQVAPQMSEDVRRKAKLRSTARRTRRDPPLDAKPESPDGVSIEGFSGAQEVEEASVAKAPVEVPSACEEEASGDAESQEKDHVVFEERNTGRPTHEMLVPGASTTRMLLEDRMRRKTGADPLSDDIQVVRRFPLTDAVPKSAAPKEVAHAKKQVVAHAGEEPLTEENTRRLLASMNAMIVDIITVRAGCKKPHLHLVAGTPWPQTWPQTPEELLLPPVDPNCLAARLGSLPR